MPGLRSGDREALEDALKRYDVAWTIFAPDGRIVAALDRERGWRRLYADATALFHVRDTAPEAGGLTSAQARRAVLHTTLCFQ